ncbi:serine hydrolase [Microbacterium esteraromaticum]|uniref:serine hydrolase domain-containing protein n=1 Tax=Microbacterium esteraromaticum TaxID=57043 RepID=UPI003C2EAECA
MVRRKSVRAGAAGAVALGMLVLSACSGETSSPVDGVVLGTQPNADVLALPQGETSEQRIAEALEELPDIAERVLAETDVPGMSIAVVHGDDTVYSQGFGVREIGADEPVTPDTVFQIASLSKPLSATGVAAAIAESESYLDWQTPIRDLMPGVFFSDPVAAQSATVGDAFSHRTGMFTGTGDDLEDIGYDRDEILQRLQLNPLDVFRDSYHYSNFGLTVGAEAVAVSRGQTWEELMDELVFEPLGMDSSSARHDDYLSRTDRAVLHAKIDGAFTPRYDRDPDAQAPAGGVSSTANDLALWMRVLLAEGESDQMSIDADALREAMSPQVISGGGNDLAVRPSHYGFGFNASPLLSGRMAYSHSGAFVLGAGTAFQVVPDLDLGIVVLTNGAPVGAAESVIAEFTDLVQFGFVTRDWTADFGGVFAGYLTPIGDLAGSEAPGGAALPDEADALTGRYTNDYFGDMEIVAVGDGLVARIGPGGVTEMALQPWDEERMAYAPENENAPYGSLASAWVTHEDGGVQLRLDTFDTRGLGTWTKTS